MSYSAEYALCAFCAMLRGMHTTNLIPFPRRWLAEQIEQSGPIENIREQLTQLREAINDIRRELAECRDSVDVTLSQLLSCDHDDGGCSCGCGGDGGCPCGCGFDWDDLLVPEVSR